MTPNIAYAPRAIGPLYPDLGVDLVHDRGLAATGIGSFTATVTTFLPHSGSPMRWGSDAADQLLTGNGMRRTSPWELHGDYLTARVSSTPEQVADTLPGQGDTPPTGN